MLEVKKLNAGYGQAQVLWDVSLTVNDGEIVAILGPNGAGKSTLVNTISGIHKASDGSITFDGTDLTKVKAHSVSAHGVAVVPEGRRIFPGMNVADNLAVGAYNKQARPDQAETLAFVYNIFPKLDDRSNQIAGSLSGGEQQMLAIGRGLMAHPSLLLLDEPSLGLAPIIVKDIFRILEEISKTGVSILLVEQNVADALNLAARAYVLEEGRIVLEGASDKLLGDERLRQAYLGL